MVTAQILAHSRLNDSSVSEYCATINDRVKQEVMVMENRLAQ